MKKNAWIKLVFALLFFVGATVDIQAQKNARFEVGDKAPNINIKDVKGDKLNLKSLAKDQKVLLVFLRHAWCPVCNFRTHELIKNYEALKAKGYEIVVVYESKQEKLIDYVEDKKLPYRVIADPEGDLYKLYRVERSQKKMKLGIGKKGFKELYAEGTKLYGEKGLEAYKAEGEGETSMLIPADFVIEGQKITTSYYGKFLGDHLAIKDIK
ncbi:MAG: AhpC/TSA family protein [Aureispira sp.]|nr:AhpC/TSA family protein [Aureispira sp.]